MFFTVDRYEFLGQPVGRLPRNPDTGDGLHDGRIGPEGEKAEGFTNWPGIDAGDWGRTMSASENRNLLHARD